MTDKDLTVLIPEDIKLSPNKIEAVVSSFGEYFKQAKDIASRSQGIVVNNESEVDLMKTAKVARLELRNLRISVEKTRVELKEQSLREGRAIDGAANIIKALIIPIEEHLEKQEKFAEILEVARLNEKLAGRREQLSQYVDDLSVYSLATMSDESFATLLESSKQAKEAKIEADRKVEAQRLEQEKKSKLYFSRKDQLIPYWIFLKGDQISTDWGEIPEESFLIILNEAKEAKQKDAKERMRINQENEKLRVEKEHEAKLRAEAEFKLRTEKEAQEKKEREAAEKIEAEKRAQEEADRKALIAPDKAKLLELADLFTQLPLPSVKSNDAQLVINEISLRVVGIVEVLREKAHKL